MAGQEASYSTAAVIALSSPWYTARFSILTTSGELAAMDRAVSSTVDISSSPGTARFTRPIASASRPETTRPV
jgi:hypothetical protein